MNAQNNTQENQSVVEVGILLDKPLKYYQKLLENQYIKKVFEVKTHDVYYSNANFDNISEKQIKTRCVRFRQSKKIRDFFKVSKYRVENYQIFDANIKESFSVNNQEYSEIVKSLKKAGFKKVFDTTKKDYHYFKDCMNSRIQLQEIEKIGLMLYYDNPKLHHLPEYEQRLELIKELNAYGFEINSETLGLDKLRTLYFGERKYSANQNG